MTDKHIPPKPPTTPTPWTSERQPPPFMPDYDLISFVGMPALDTLKPYLSQRGKELLHELSYGELARIERWWKRVRKHINCCGEYEP